MNFLKKIQIIGLMIALCPVGTLGASEKRSGDSGEREASPTKKSAIVVERQDTAVQDALPAAGAGGPPVAAAVAPAAMANSVVPVTQPRGLRNHGNTCFMNAMLQCLFANATLVAFLQDCCARAADMQLPDVLLGSLQPLMGEYFQPDLARPENLSACLKPFVTNLRTCFDDRTKIEGIDGDAGEACMKLLDKARAVLGDNNRIMHLASSKYKFCPLAAGCPAGGQYYRSTFAERFQNTVKLGVPERRAWACTSISEMLHNLQMSLITSANGIACDYCHEHMAVAHDVDMVLPDSPYLAFAIDRVNHETNKKRLNPVMLEEYINFKSSDDLYAELQASLQALAAAGGIAAGVSVEANPIPINIPAAQYRLVAFACHMGDADRGHWFAYTRGMLTMEGGIMRRLNADVWYSCNDSIVSPVEMDFTEAKPGVSLVVYERVPVDQVVAAIPEAPLIDFAPWACPACTVVHGPAVVACNVCGYGMPEEPVEPVGSAAASSSAAAASSATGKPWECTYCETKNAGDNPVCSECEALLCDFCHSVNPKGSDDICSQCQAWLCPQCSGGQNEKDAMECSECEAWKCSKCTFVNDNKHKKCNICHGARGLA